MDAETLTHLIRLNYAHRARLQESLGAAKRQMGIGHPAAQKLQAALAQAEHAAGELATALAAKFNSQVAA